MARFLYTLNSTQRKAQGAIDTILYISSTYASLRRRRTKSKSIVLENLTDYRLSFSPRCGCDLRRRRVQTLRGDTLSCSRPRLRWVRPKHGVRSPATPQVANKLLESEARRSARSVRTSAVSSRRSGVSDQRRAQSSALAQIRTLL